MKNKSKSRKIEIKTSAYCYRNGVIEFGRVVPEGAIPIHFGPENKLRAVIDVVARHGYPSKPGAGDGKLLVPGIPEADTASEAFEALRQFFSQVALRMAKK